MNRMIVKVQWPISSNEIEPRALVYDRERSFNAFIATTPELRERMDGQLKAYFYANTLEGIFSLLERAPSQDW